jgi:SAM-dependent methyltransferase/organic radical activating enzyme
MSEQRINIENFRSMVRKPLNENDINADHQWRFQQLGGTFDKDLGLKGKYCYHPFNTVTIDSKGECYVCTCQAWLPISVGNILDFNSLREISHSPRAREIQASIIDGTYKYCDNKTCHLIAGRDLASNIGHRVDNINWIVFAIDESCNLSCPSCRTELVFHNKGDDFENRMKISNHLVKLIQEHNNFLKFTLSGDGDPFASHVYRNLLENLQIKNHSQTEIEIATNGILVKSSWEKMSGVHNSVIRFKISFDAGSPEVYSITRRGGDWNKLIENSKYIIDWKKRTNSQMQIVANFVVQTTNYRDIPNFVKTTKDLGFDEISFQKVVDWGKWGFGETNTFANHAVWMTNHPNHDELVEIINLPIMADRKIQLNNLASLRRNLAKLSELVTVKHMADSELHTHQLKQNVEQYMASIHKITEYPGPHQIHAKMMLSDSAQLIRQLESIESSAKRLISDVDHEIGIVTSEYHQRGYRINGSFATNRTSVEGERTLRNISIRKDIKERIIAIIQKYSDWRYPALEIGPGDGVWSEYLVANEPLYLVDIHQEFLDSTKNAFNSIFQNRIRDYKTKETDLSMLPQNQFGFVFSWNVFNYLTSDLVDQYLKQIYNVLRPGGVLMFSYNNAERVLAAIAVETGFMSYLPKTLLLQLAEKHQFEILATPDLNDDNVSWVELRKPGMLTTSKAHPALGKIIQK